MIILPIDALISSYVLYMHACICICIALWERIIAINPFYNPNPNLMSKAWKKKLYLAKEFLKLYEKIKVLTPRLPQDQRENVS